MPVDRAAALAIGRGARRLLVKAGRGIERFDAGPSGLPDDAVVPHLVHEDGLLRVPVLVLGDVVVRGFTEELYREALASLPRRE